MDSESRKKLIISTFKAIILLIIIIGLPLYIWLCHGDIVRHWNSVDDVVSFLEKYETVSIFVYIMLQIIQVVISVIPGQVFQMAAGYLYGFWPALIYAMTGAIAGTIISFMLAKLLGRDFLHIIFGEEKISYYIERLNSKRVYVIVFLIYLIPGIPKDMVSYAAGVSEIKFKPFIILSTVGRVPGMVGSLLMGSMLEEQKFGFAIGIGIFAVIACVFCIIYRERILQVMDKIYGKLSG